MNDKKIKAIATALVVVMALIFIGIISYVSLRNIARSAGDELFEKREEEELNPDLTNQDDANEADSTELEQISYEVVDVSDQIKSISDVDEGEEDLETHDFEVESVFVNTIELLPSIYQEHEVIEKSKVDISAFPDSYELAGRKTVEIAGATISVPKEVYLYNSLNDKSSEFTVEIGVSGEIANIKSIGWASTDSDKVAVSANSGERVTVSAVDGQFSGLVPVTIYVAYKNENGGTQTEEFTLDVYVESISYGDDQLRDLQGNALYLDSFATKAAHVSDFSSHDYFYGAIKTTGWQTFDGKKYYYDSNSWPVTGHQIIGGLPYDFDEDGVLKSASLDLKMGIDVSKYQKDIDWDLVAASGISFAIVRCGFRGGASGCLVEDPYFYKNVKGASDAGIAVGVYFFTQAINEREAIEEASMAIKMCEGYNISLPIYIDSEGLPPRGRANNLSRDLRTRCLKAFCETVNSAGYVGGVYASKSWFNNQVYARDLENYNIWVAQYNTECNYKGKTNFWQYSSKEHIAGIVGNVDVDVVFEQERMD